MASLVSPGVVVTIIDNSLFIPAQAVTVPLIFVATADQKLQPDGLTPAAGTYEDNVVRTVTSITQSLQLYGVPVFQKDGSGNQFYGDCRNEYGLVALNQFLNVASQAYVMRAHVNVDDNLNDIRALWQSNMSIAATTLENLVTTYITNYNTTNNLIPSDSGYMVTVTGAELQTLILQAMAPVFAMYNFSSLAPTNSGNGDFLTDNTLTPLLVFANGYNAASTGTFIGMIGIINNWVNNNLGGTVPNQFTPSEAQNLLLAASDDFQFTREFRTDTALGTNDAARRAVIVTALQAAVIGAEQLQAENYQYNLIVCPGFPELSDDLLALALNIQNEAFVIGDVPMNLDPDTVVSSWSVSIQKQSSNNIAYYYPHVIVTNLDGTNVLVPSSVAALTTYAYSDSVSQVWFAPAGTTRGLLTGVIDIGYCSGTLGTANTFVQTYLNLGQRNNLYKYFTNINPIVFFPNRGILIWGQKTSANVASALDRVNVARLICYIKRALRENTLGFVFEPNDAITQASIKTVVDGFLSGIVVLRGLTDYASICNSSNNTPTVVQQNELIVDVAIQPTIAAEFIYINITVESPGASLTGG